MEVLSKKYWCKIKEEKKDKRRKKEKKRRKKKKKKKEKQKDGMSIDCKKMEQACSLICAT